MAKTFQLLSETKVPIRTCEQILLNNLQCWKPASVLVTSTEPERTIQYQLCKSHAMFVQQIEAEEQAATAEASQSTKDLDVKDVDPKIVVQPAQQPDLQKKLLHKEALAQQTSMPKGEDSPNNK